MLDLINRCCDLDPAKRPTAKQVVLALEGGSATPSSPEVSTITILREQVLLGLSGSWAAELWGDAVMRTIAADADG